MIAVIGAMELEVKTLCSAMERPEPSVYAGMTFYKGRIGGREAVVVRSGVGKVNAAVCAQILIDRFSPSAMVNTGIAGAVARGLGPGDLVLSTEALHHDMDAAGFGYGPGLIPQMECSIFPADQRLLSLAAERCAAVNPGVKAIAGRVVTGDQFISSREKVAWLRQTFLAACVEMEGAAIAQTAYLNGLPFLIVRTMSDSADDDAPEVAKDWEQKAADRSARLALELITHWE